MPLDGLSLVGFMSKAVAEEYLEKVCIIPKHNRSVARSIFHQAKDKLGDPVPNAGQPIFIQEPASFAQHVQTLISTPHFVNPIDKMQVDFGYVELAPLISFQSHVAIQHAQGRPCFQMGVMTETRLQELCLPTMPPIVDPPLLLTSNPNKNYFELTSNDLNASWLEHIRTVDIRGNIQQYRIDFGVSLPFMQVVEYKGKWFLRNGYHRAVGLLANNIEYAPAIVLHASSREQVSEPGHIFDDCLMSNDPPTVLHLASGRAHPVQLRRARRKIIIAQMTEFVE